MRQFLENFKIGAVGFDCSIHWLPNKSNLKHTLDVRQTNNMKQRTRVFEIQKWKSRNPGGWNNWKHPWSSLRHIFPPLIVPHCHRGRSVQKAQRKYIIKRQPRKKRPSEKSPPCLTLAPSALALFYPRICPHNETDHHSKWSLLDWHWDDFVQTKYCDGRVWWFFINDIGGNFVGPISE